MTTKKPVKKGSPKIKPQEPKGKAAKSQELSEDQLEHVAGGAVDYFLKIDTIETDKQFKV